MSIAEARTRDASPATIAPSPDAATVASVLARLNAAWQSGDYAMLAECFDADVVMMLPNGTGRVEGREPIVASYRDFMESATITEYHEDPPAIDVWGDTAVASYRWAMSWVTRGAPDSGAGCDVLVFRRMAGPGALEEEWRAVWRTMMLEPAPE